MPLGSGALAGTTYPLDREFVASELGFDAVTMNSLDGVSDRDFVIELANCLALVMMHLSRFCEELILWSSNEFSFVEMDDAFSTGSSIMPQKKKYRYREPVQIFQKLLYALQKKIWICWKKPEIKVWQNFWKAICLNRWTEPLE